MVCKKMDRKLKVPPRLTTIFDPYEYPIFFITFCTRNREKILTDESIHQAFRRFTQKAQENHDVLVGRYVIMPEHIHFFVKIDRSKSLGKWIGSLKRYIGANCTLNSLAWQPGFFDHMLRDNENLMQKGEYVRQNPVRAGLVKDWQEWPYQGLIYAFDGYRD